MSTKLLSIMLMSYNSGERIPKAYVALKEILDKESIPFEFIVMDDGSKDNSYNIACELEKKYDNVRAFRLSRNFGVIYSAFAGLSLCKGDCAIHIPDDEQIPYDLIPKMFRLWENGQKVIIPCRTSRNDGVISDFFSGVYYKMMNSVSSISFPPGGADCAFIDRELIDLMTERIHPKNTMMITEIINLGFDPLFLPFARPEGLNKGHSRWTFRKKLKLAKDSLFSMSTFPLKLITYVGAFLFVLSIFLSAFYIYIRVWGNDAFWGVPVPGWTSLLIVMLFFGGLVMLSMGILSEYIWRIYDEVKDRPGYIIRKKDEE